jgi:hypothetical protein
MAGTLPLLGAVITPGSTASTTVTRRRKGSSQIVPGRPADGV